jgi:L-threonylcarbamoyladenylate synthase
MYGTKIIEVSASDPQKDVIDLAAGILRWGGLVAFPTETVYGLGADAMNEDAVKEVFRVKGRKPDNPLIVHISAPEQLEEFGKNVSPLAKRIAAKLFPGPLTLVVEASPKIPKSVTGNLQTVALRMPDHRVALALIKALGSPIVGPSANLSGKPSPTAAEHVSADLGGEIDLILDAGPTTIGVESTVVDVTGSIPVLLRVGGLSKEAVEDVAGKVRFPHNAEELKRSPGTRYRHYAPRAKVILITDGDREAFEDLWKEYTRRGMHLGCIVHSAEFLSHVSLKPVTAFTISVEEYPKQLFAILRTLDSMEVDAILIEEIPEYGLGAAVMDRLRRAAE